VARFDSGIPSSLIGIDLLANYDLQSLCNKIKAEKEAGYFVIVYPHWGNEYQTTHSSAQRDLAEKMIDSGADLIIGSHPHVVQDMQIYKGKPIIYSLGNLVFDQTFSKETQQGMLCGGKIYQDHIELSFFPTEQINLKPQFARDDRRLGLLNRLFANNDLKFLGSDTIILSR
jgi:poly-gamma-glutamate capsule biosynthesis protein CapA/YwtB (metallophosphatase superfamily)